MQQFFSQQQQPWGLRQGFSRFAFGFSMVLWGQIRLGPPEGSTQGSTKVSPTSYQSSSKGARLPTGSVLKGSVASSPRFQALALGSPAITKFLGQNDTFVFLSSLQHMAFASQRFFGPQTVFLLIYVGLTISRGFLGKWLLFPKMFFRKCSVKGSANYYFFTVFPPNVLSIYLSASSWGQCCVNC